MGKRKKRTYTAEQRAEAVKIALGSGKPITQAAKDLDVGVSVLRHWLKQAQIDKAADPNGSLTSEERAELAKSATRAASRPRAMATAPSSTAATGS